MDGQPPPPPGPQYPAIPIPAALLLLVAACPDVDAVQQLVPHALPDTLVVNGVLDLSLLASPAAHLPNMADGSRPPHNLALWPVMYSRAALQALLLDPLLVEPGVPVAGLPVNIVLLLIHVVAYYAVTGNANVPLSRAQATQLHRDSLPANVPEGQLDILLGVRMLVYGFPPVLAPLPPAPPFVPAPQVPMPALPPPPGLALPEPGTIPPSVCT